MHDEGSPSWIPPCGVCGDRVPTVFVSLSKTRGALIVRYDTQLDSLLCKVCLQIQFWQFTEDNLIYGWWSPFSAFLTPIYTIQNVLAYSRAKAMFKRLAGQKSE